MDGWAERAAVSKFMYLGFGFIFLNRFGSFIKIHKPVIIKKIIIIAAHNFNSVLLILFNLCRFYARQKFLMAQCH
jgi:hypothetical protein